MTLTQEVVNKILGYARENGLKAGDSLPKEAELVEMFGISRNILREALSYLKGLGMVESRRRSGFRLTKPDFISVMGQVLTETTALGLADMDELFEIRRSLELGLIKEAVTQANQQDTDLILQKMANLEEYLDNGGRYYSEYNLLEAEFHSAIIQPAKCRMLDIVNASIREFFRSTDKGQELDSHSIENLRRDNLEHRLIATAFELRQPQTAHSCLEQHLGKKIISQNNSD